jgi:phage baseplate assembly protein W
MAFVYENVNNTTTNDTGLGVGLSNLNSIFSTVYTIPQQIRENLKKLLLTRIGERYMQPTYGTNLLDIIFQPNTNDLKPEIEDILVESINFWLPYVQIEAINIITAEDDPALPHQIQISILYSIQNFKEETITVFANNDNTLSVV